MLHATTTITGILSKILFAFLSLGARPISIEPMLITHNESTHENNPDAVNDNNENNESTVIHEHAIPTAEEALTESETNIPTPIIHPQTATREERILTINLFLKATRKNARISEQLVDHIIDDTQDFSKPMIHALCFQIIACALQGSGTSPRVKKEHLIAAHNNINAPSLSNEQPNEKQRHQLIENFFSIMKTTRAIHNGYTNKFVQKTANGSYDELHSTCFAVLEQAAINKPEKSQLRINTAHCLKALLQ